MEYEQHAVVKAKFRPYRTLSAVWIVPTIAAFIVAYMAWHSHTTSGPTINITFNTAEGLTAGQTQIRYRAVTLGTVADIRLDAKSKKVLVKAKMSKSAEEFLTDKAQFWIVRPRLTAGNLSGLETLVSGSYIQCDPGSEGGNTQAIFTGLEDPPGTRTDEDGQTFKLKTERLGTIGKGSAVYFRDIEVGVVLNYDVGDGHGPILLTVFVRAPYDKMVTKTTRFWNTSSFMVGLGPKGLEVQLQSLQALLAGGITFYTPNPQEAGAQKESAAAQKDDVFRLFKDKSEADLADARKPLSFISYFDGSVKNITAGAAVTIKGIPVGEVTNVKLMLDYANGTIKAQVRYTVQPERAFLPDETDAIAPLVAVRHLVDKGLRVKIDSGLLPGQSGLSLDFMPQLPVAYASMEGDSILMPSAPDSGSLDAALDALSATAAKINQIPFERISANLNTLLNNANGTMKGFAQDSDLQSDVHRTLDEVSDAARSVHLLVDYLNRHPEALIQGRSIKDKDAMP